MCSSGSAMSQQLDFVEPQPLKVAGQLGVTEPRFWFWCLVLWFVSGGEKIRDVTFGSGLNVIWSPDRIDETGQDNAIGHGSGKTLFCRLIRYCLGEGRFSTESQRERIGAAFINGLVGAEVFLDGVLWAIVRPLGIRRRHMAVPNGDLEELAAGEGTSSGLEPFVEAVERSVITPELSELVQPGTGNAMWPVAIAWLTRDQECRFEDVLDWRSPSSDSDSPMPASGREKGPRLEALRAFLVAMTPQEHKVRRQKVGLDERCRQLDQEIAHRRGEIHRIQDRLVAALELAVQTLPVMPLLIDVMRENASERVSTATQLPAGPKAELVVARQEYESTRSEWTRLDGERIRIEASIPVEQRLLSQIKGELPGLSFSRAEAENPVCPICEVPIDRVLAEKCGLSEKLPDAEACRARWGARKRELAEQLRRIDALREERTQTLSQLALVKQRLEPLVDRVAAIERARDSRENAWYRARTVQDDVERLADLIGAQDEAQRNLATLGSSLERARNRLAALRDEQVRVFGRLTEKFDPIVRRLLGRNANGRISLSGNGIEASIDLGGERSTAAIDSLKVLAFDLAALCLSMEGATRVPAFLLHDSPREADLGLSIYHELFRLALDLEGQTPHPLFQYIVTTTTEPPETLTSVSRLWLIIRGMPAEQSLLKVDL